MKLIVAFLVISRLCLSSVLAGENRSQGARISESTPHIALDVVVNDKSGAPVSGLQKQDFTIIDNKQTQKDFSFSAVTPQSESATEVILVLDAVNTSFTRVAFARDQVKKFLRQEGGKLAQPVTIAFFSDNGLKIDRPASRDGNDLATYVDNSEAALRFMRRSQGFYGAADRAQLSLRVLDELATREERRPGRKLVVWISPGWALLSGPGVQLSGGDQQGIFSTIVGASTHLRQARITLYAVDPLGTQDPIGRTFYYQEFLKAVKSARDVHFGDLALQVLAVQSGGRVLNSNNGIAEEIERCVRDAGAYYVLELDAPAADGPNEYHAIEIKLDRPGLKAQTRAGYYAQPATGKP